MPRKPSKRNHLFPALAIALLVLASLYYIAWSSGYFATPTQTRLMIDVEDCQGELGVQVEITDSEGRRLPDALVDISVDGELRDSLYADRNGMVSLDLDVERDWCGREVGFHVRYRGDENHLPSSMTKPATVKAPTSLELILPKQTTEGEEVNATVILTDAVSGMRLEGKTVLLGDIREVTDGNGSAVFGLAFDAAGEETLAAEFEGHRYYEPSESEDEKISVLPLTCEDGTLVGGCSGSYLCGDDLELDFSCDECGCPQGLLCIDNKCITEEERLRTLIEKLQKSDVLVESDDGQGSGVIIEEGSDESRILTARHVVDPDFTAQPSTNIQVFNSEREVAQPTSILLAPNDIDLAVIVIGKYMGPAVDVRDNDSIERGAEILAIGSPLGIQDSVSKGIISNVYETETESEYEFEAIQIDAAVNPGNSGGGLFLAKDGRLIGVTSFKLLISKVELAEGLGFAVPVSLLEEFPVDGWQAVSPG